MCGIAGLFSTHPVDPLILDRMIQKLHHRGPDSNGVFIDPPFYGGMARLKINDLKSGDQPLFNSRKDVVLFYNGEIYNAPRLRKELENDGVVFRTHSDGEVIPHLYDRNGEALFEMLDGMFAAALWDVKQKKLILARDFPGEKPLFFSRLPGDQGLVFASEIKALLSHPGVNRALDDQAIWDFPTFSWIPQPRTIFKSVESLMPGEMLVVQGASSRRAKFRYNSPVAQKLRDHGTPKTEKQWIQLTREVVENTVRSRLLSDVPVGSFLSGGLDSSIIATLASRERPDLRTFTIGFDDKEDLYHGMADESAEAQETATRLGVKHTTIRVGGRDFRELLDDYVYYGDQPFSVSSGMGILAVAREAKRQGIKVLLSGDGADECFGGYSWYSELHRISHPATGDSDSDASYLSLSIPLEDRLKLMEGYSSAKQAWAWHYYASEPEKQNLYSKDRFGNCLSSIRWFSNPDKPRWNDIDFISQDREFYFPNEMLQKVDRMTMAHSVEGRAPFAAMDIHALANQLPLNLMIRGNTLKWLLREAFKDVLPPEVIARKKHGFNVPLDYWFRNDWSDLVRETFSESSALSKEGILSKGADKFAHELIHGQRRVIGHTILSFIVLNRWLQLLRSGNYSGDSASSPEPKFDT